MSFTFGVYIRSSLIWIAINAGSHIPSNVERRSTDIVNAGLLQAVTERDKFSTNERILISLQTPSLHESVLLVDCDVVFVTSRRTSMMYVAFLQFTYV